MTRTLARLTLAATAAALLLAAGTSSAQTATANIAVSATVNKTCTVGTVPVAFGAYDPTPGVKPTAPGSVTVTCTKGTTWSVDLGNGGNKGSAVGFASNRAMTDGTHFLAYELYADAGYVSAWYTGTAVGANGVSNGKTSPTTLSVHARIEDTDPYLGIYGDTVVATVNF